MRSLVCVGSFLAMLFSTQSCLASQPDTHLLVVATTSLTTSVVYCRAKYGDFDNAEGKQCFLRARDILANFPFEQRATLLREKCPQDEFKTCLTPAISRHAAELVEAFKRAGL